MTVTRILELLSEGMLVSLQIFFLTLIFSMPLGLIICWGRMSRIKIISWLFRLYISIMRGTPLMLQLFVVYFCPFYLFGVELNTFGNNYRLTAVLIGFVLNYAAYFAEIYRSGISSISEGQYEAAKVLGMNKAQTFFIIILPQVFRNILPALANEIITLVKDTSLAFAIGQMEMFTKAKVLASSTRSMMPYVVAGGVYYVFNLIVAGALSRLEKQFGKYSIK